MLKNILSLQLFRFIIILCMFFMVFSVSFSKDNSGKEEKTELPEIAGSIEAVSFDGIKGIIIAGIPEDTMGYIVKTKIFRTEDGGESWQEVFEVSTGEAEEIYFMDEENIWLVTQWQIEATYPTLIRSSDGGKTWQEGCSYNIPELGNCFVYMKDIKFKDTDYGIVKIIDESYGDGKVYYMETSDGGSNWVIIGEDNLPESSGYDWYNNSDCFFPEESNRWEVEKCKGKFLVLDSEGEIIFSVPGAE